LYQKKERKKKENSVLNFMLPAFRKKKLANVVEGLADLAYVIKYIYIYIYIQ